MTVHGTFQVLSRLLFFFFLPSGLFLQKKLPRVRRWQTGRREEDEEEAGQWRAYYGNSELNAVWIGRWFYNNNYPIQYTVWRLPVLRFFRHWKVKSIINWNRSDIHRSFNNSSSSSSFSYSSSWWSLFLRSSFCHLQHEYRIPLWPQDPAEQAKNWVNSSLFSTFPLDTFYFFRTEIVGSCTKTLRGQVNLFRSFRVFIESSWKRFISRSSFSCFFFFGRDKCTVLFYSLTGMRFLSNQSIPSRKFQFLQSTFQKNKKLFPHQLKRSYHFQFLKATKSKALLFFLLLFS